MVNVGTGASTNRWRSLRVGDNIRISEMPDEVWAAHGETKAQFEYLLHNRLVVKVTQIDDEGYPWIGYTRLSEDGVTIHEYLLINHDGIEIVPALT